MEKLALCISCVKLFESTTDPNGHMCEECYAELARRYSKNEAIPAQCEECKQEADRKIPVLPDKAKQHVWLCIPCWQTQFTQRSEQLMQRLTELPLKLAEYE